MKEFRCLKCNSLLGKVEGKAEKKCYKSHCRAINYIDTETGYQIIVKE